MNIDPKSIREMIRAHEYEIAFLRQFLEEEIKKPVPPQNDIERISEITTLRILSKSDRWPQAVPEDLICGQDEDQKLARAAGLINDFIRSDLTDKNFLDFGCGEGHVPYIATNLGETKKAVGYDLKNQNWNQFDTNNLPVHPIFSTNWKEVQDNGPYDVILLNDVLDHADDPNDVLNKIQSVKRPSSGKIYVRCHPWTSRHGTHLYKQLNKAYLHLVFTEDELFSMGLNSTKTKIILDPLEFYRKSIKDAGFTVLQEEKITHPVELFFTNTPEILRRIKEKWTTSTKTTLSTGWEFPRETLEIQFVDYCLI